MPNLDEPSITVTSNHELPVLAQDPRFGGGFRSLAAAFWTAAAELGCNPRLFYVSRERGLSPRMRGPRFAALAETSPPFRGEAIPSFVPEYDAVNLLVGGQRIARRIRGTSLCWVVAASAPYGWGAYRSGSRYGCWLATSLSDEWAARTTRLSASRRFARAVSRPLLLRMERAVVRGATIVAATSDRSRQELAVASGLPPSRIHVWPVPVDLDRFSPAPDSRWEVGLGSPTLVFVGRGGDPRKNVGLLVQAFGLVRRQIPAAKLRIVGEPPPDSVAPNTPGIDVVGEVPSVVDELRTASLFILPSLQEGFGIVVAEAFACGVPAVVTPSGGPEELVRRSGAGVVLNGFEATEMATTIVDLLGDRTRMMSMRRAARAYVEREHSPERLLEIVRAALEATATETATVGP